MKEYPFIGLVTVLYYGKEMLSDFFESLADQNYKNFRLWVVDNSEDDEALNLCRELAGVHDIDIVTIKSEKNVGVAAGNNIGIESSRKAGTEYTLLLNYDIDFPPDAIDRLVHHAQMESEDIVVPKIYYAGSNILWMAGGEIYEKKGINSHRGIKKEDNGQFDRIEYVGYAPTCFMLIRNSVFKEVGLMDENYFVYFDDTDFVYRALKKGFKICYVPQSTVNHKVSISTGGEESPFSVYYLNRNRFYFILKNFNGYNKLRGSLYTIWDRIKWLPKADKKQRESFWRAIFDLPEMLRKLRD